MLSAEIDGIRRWEVEEQDCTPEYLIDQDLGGDQALYYGHGQFHVVGMLDMHRDEVKHDIQFDSAAALQIRPAEESFDGLIPSSERSTAHTLEGHESWLLRNTQEGQQKVARFATDVDHFDGIATTSVTLNYAVPVPGLDPARTCPYTRLTAAGIETGPFTSIRACDGEAASDQSRKFLIMSEQALHGCILFRSAQIAIYGSRTDFHGCESENCSRRE